MGKASGTTKSGSSASPKGLSGTGGGVSLSQGLNRIEIIAKNIADKKSTGSPFMEEVERGYEINYSRENDGGSAWDNIVETARITLSEDGRKYIVNAQRSKYERIPFSTGNNTEDYRSVTAGNDIKEFSVNEKGLTQKILKFLKKK